MPTTQATPSTLRASRLDPGELCSPRLAGDDIRGEWLEHSTSLSTSSIISLRDTLDLHIVHSDSKIDGIVEYMQVGNKHKMTRLSGLQ